MVKRAALLCDELLAETIEGELRTAEQAGIVKGELAAFSHNAIQTISPGDEHEGITIVTEAKESTRQSALNASAAVKALIAKVESARSERLNHSRDLVAAFDDALGQMTLSGVQLADTLPRMYARLLRLTNAADVFIPIVSSDLVAPSIRCDRATIVRVVMENLPLPGDGTPWEAIVDWRSDKDAHEQYLAIRSWIASLARGGFSEVDVHEEIASRLATYERYMSIHHKKMTRSRVEAIVLPLAEVLESLAHLRFSDAAKTLFRLYREETQILEAELAAPGREVAYIATTTKSIR